MDKDPIEVYFKDEDKKYFTIDEVSEILDLEQSKIIFYYEKLNDFLNITSVGMYQVFEQNDIDNLKTIKELNIDKDMNISEIKKYLDSHKQEVILHKEKNELDNSFINFLGQILDNQNKKIDIIVENSTKMIDIINTMNENQQGLKTEVSSLSNELSDIKNEMNKRNELLEKENALKIKQLERKQESEQQTQGILSRLFNKKK